MAKLRFLRVKNIEKYQHYKGRTGPWVKLYHSLLDDPDFLSLSEVHQCRYMKLLLIAHRTGNAILDDAIYLQKMMRISDIPDITPLKQAGFLLESGYSKSRIVLGEVMSDFPRSTLLLSSLPNSQNPDSPEKHQVPKKEGNGRASVLPPEFAFDERAAQLAASYGLNPHKEFAAFKDHAAAKGRICKDWQAAFRNWLRNSVKFNEKRMK